VLRVVSLAVIVMAAAALVRAQGDPEVGRELALRWCTSCHVVDLEGHGADAGPALPALLRDGQRTADELRGWLAAPIRPCPTSISAARRSRTSSPIWQTWPGNDPSAPLLRRQTGKDAG
jgi:mono/diheme cytochrome c family protein